MKQFLKYVLATVVGLFIMFFFSIFLFFGIIGAIASSGDVETKLSSNSVYELDLSGVLSDRSEGNPFADIFADEMGKDVSIGLDDILVNIKKAKENPKILGIRLNCGAFSAGYASLKEIRTALIDFKASGKFIVSYGDMYTQKQYYLASVSDKILLNPIGGVAFTGLSSTTMFFKDLLENIGVEMQIVRVGEFKSAVEPFIATKMSDANRKQTEVFLHSMWNNILKELSESRKLTIEQLNAEADKEFLFTEASKAIANGFVDSLVYESEVLGVIKSFIEDGTTPKMVSHKPMMKVASKKKYEKNKIAVIYAVGGIDMSARDGIQSEKLVKTIAEVAKDESVKSVVFRINSPGGSAYGSEQIWKALSNLKEKKSLIVSMGDYAASGGYYIACLGDKILAQPTTLTGSIGVFGQIPNAEKLSQKIGVSFDVVNTNKFSQGVSIYRPFNPEERGLMQAYVNQTYDLFLQRCADGRGKSVEEIKKYAEGRVWSGENALEIGLIDELGGLEEAVALAAKFAELENYSVLNYPEKEDFFTKLMKGMGEDIEAYALKSYFGESYSLLKKANFFKDLNGVYALMPYDIDVK